MPDASQPPRKLLKAKYRCDKCNLDGEVEVRERYPDENVINYVHHVGNKCGIDHGLRSPLCHPETLTHVMVPFTQNGIGFDGPELTSEQKADIDRQLKEPLKGD